MLEFTIVTCPFYFKKNFKGLEKQEKIVIIGSVDILILKGAFTMSEENGSMSLKERHELVEGYLGKVVTIEIDRPIGYVHHKGEKTLIYPINYGFIPNVLGGDGEELDVFLMGVDEPVSSYTGQIIGIIYRSDDVEDKLVMAPLDSSFPAEDIACSVYFQEKYYHTTVRSIDGSTAQISAGTSEQ